MGRLKRFGESVASAARWTVRQSRNRLSPRGRVIFDWIAGSVLIVIGIIGGPVPILQGWIFILAGLAVLSKHSRLARRAMEKIKRAGRSVRERVAGRDEGQGD